MMIVAHIILEAKSALHFGCGDFDALQDSPVQRDFNGLPMILGTSICGVIRANAKEIFSPQQLDSLFGYAHKKEAKDSRLIFSNALLLDKDMRVNESLIPHSKLEKSPFLSHFLNLPQRQHNAISAQGVCKDGAKFDKEVIYKGTLFKCAISMDLSSGENGERDKEAFFKILGLFCSPFFRLGAGSTKGFGVIKPISITYEILNSPFSKSSSLNENLAQNFTPDLLRKSDRFTHYVLKIMPENVFLFGAGFGDSEADSIGVREKVVDYDKGDLSEAKLLIPASSIKGAVSQRTRYYINTHLGNSIAESNDNSKDSKADKIHATLFGSADSSDKESTKSQATKGKILISDIYLDFDKEKDSQIFAHNSIDRFTGGCVDGALFQEKADFGSEFVLNIFVDTSHKSQDFEIALQSFEKALNDICAGFLPLGAASSKGHGFFSGSLEKNGVKIHTNTPNKA